jgi:hypothetical protein
MPVQPISWTRAAVLTPAFGVTLTRYVTGSGTNRGLVRPPFAP